MVKGIIYVSMRLTLLAPMILALSSCGNGGGSEEGGDSEGTGESPPADSNEGDWEGE